MNFSSPVALHADRSRWAIHCFRDCGLQRTPPAPAPRGDRGDRVGRADGGRLPVLFPTRRSLRRRGLGRRVPAHSQSRWQGGGPSRLGRARLHCTTRRGKRRLRAEMAERWNLACTGCGGVTASMFRAPTVAESVRRPPDRIKHQTNDHCWFAAGAARFHPCRTTSRRGSHR